MIRVLVDTNVVLDALLKRLPWEADAIAILKASLDGHVDMHLTATSLTDIFYIARKLADRAKAWEATRACLDQLVILSVSATELRAAATDLGPDFEDNLQLVCALAAGLDAIVTRDPKGFTNSPIPVWSPAELLAQLPTDASA